jgi:2-iminobutanoate/2-iminopropanoate deaminase
MKHGKAVEEHMMTKVKTANAPAAIGPYSQAIVANGCVYVSGQLPIDPRLGILSEGDIKTLTTLVIDNLEAILVAAGSSLEKVVRTDVFLKDLKKDFAAMNEIYASRFSISQPPARQTVQVSELPLGSPIEISCIALV